MERLLKKKWKAEADNNKVLLASVCIDLAEYHLNRSDYYSAIEEYNTVAMIYKEQNKMLDYACANRMIGEAYTQLHLYEKALEYEQIYLNVAQSENNKMEEQRALATIGHIYLTMALCTDEPSYDQLKHASKCFFKSLAICEKLSGISKTEQMDMKARLYANLGVVEEAQGNFDKGIELVQTSANICKKYDIYEQLERSYTTLSSLYAKSGHYNNSISSLNLAMEVASRLPDKISLTCSSLIVKADILMKMSDIQGAKRVLHKAYKLRTPVKLDSIAIENNLKIVAAMSNAEESLLVTAEQDYKARKILYEKLGDAACYFKNYSSAIEYYKMMLDSAIKNGEQKKSLSPCYISLAQTYLDDKQYDKAIEYYKLDLGLPQDDLKDYVNTQFNIIHAMKLGKKNPNDVLDIFKELQCITSQSKKQLARVLERQILFLKYNSMLSEAARKQIEFDQLNYTPTDSESEPDEVCAGLGDDVDIENITDLSSSEDERDLSSVTTKKRTRNKGLAVKRNVKGETQLHVACIAGNLRLVTKLLEQGHVVNIRDHAGWLPIHEACICGHLEIVKLLIEKGAAINDRGGSKCEGITPLHDAASNGHLQVIEYILSQGASPLAKNDSGQTPLHMLKCWREGNSLSAEDEELYNRIVAIMANAIEIAGQQETSFQSVGPSDALVYVENDTSFEKSINISGPLQTRRSSFRKNRDDLSETRNTSNRILINRNSSSNHSTDLRRTINAGDDEEIISQKYASTYRETMNLLKNSGKKDMENQNSNTQPISAHLSLTDVEFYDWLEDDLNISNKKKRKMSPTFKKSDSTMSNVSNAAVNQNYSSIIDLENQEPRQSRNSNEPFPKRKRKSQITLIKSGFTRSHNSPSPTNLMFETDTAKIEDTRKIQTKINFTVNNQVQKESSEYGTNEASLNATQNLIKKQMLFVDVRINEKLFRIAFPAKDLETLTINWLADEATKRFYKKEAIKPVLEMETKNGAMLSGEDLLSILFPLGTNQCEELCAKVVKWNVPPLKERYQDACHYFNMAPCEKILQILEGTTVNLNLANKNCRSKLIPVCRALNRQTHLYELNLSGNLVGKEMVDPLCESLPSLENLTNLILSTNHIKSSDIGALASVIKTLSSLKKLDFSFNPLENESIKYLGQITVGLKLEELNLCGTGLTTGIFSAPCNQSVDLNLKYLKVLDISYNEMDIDDIKIFLSSLSSENLQSLNINNNSIKTAGLGYHLYEMLGNHSRLSLKYLNLSRCSLGDEDMLHLERALVNVEQLEELNLNFNIFTGTSLRNLLMNVSVIRLSIIGCDNVKLDWPESDTIDWRFVKNPSCQYLSTSLDYVRDFKECDMLIDMFKKMYQDKLDILGLDRGMLKLSVNNNTN